MFNNKKRNEKEKFWEKHIKKQEQSGLSRKEYCKNNNIGYDTFRKWKKRLQSTEVKELVKIPSEKLIVDIKANSQLELIINDSLRLKIPENFNDDNLSKLLHVLGVL